jgi:hypothetical protein
MRRARCLKAWDKAKQMEKDSTGNSTYVTVTEDEVVTVIEEDDTWLDVECADGRGFVPVNLSGGRPRFADVVEQDAARPAPASSDDEDEREDEGHGEFMTRHQEDEQAERERDAAEAVAAAGTGGARSPPPASPSPQAAAPLGDNDLTPGRPGAPTYIDRSDIGDWVAHEHLKYTTLKGGAYQGQVLWWDGADLYKLADGVQARLRG